MKKIAFCIAAIHVLCFAACEHTSYLPSLENGDWPQFRADAGRTGYTPSPLPANLSLRWKREQPAPSPAWRAVDTRMIFDYAYETVITGKTLFFGSSTDCKVYALDTGTGKERWSFFTDAPVRFAPTVWRDRVYVVSDDGYLYCLSKRSGEMLWKKRGGTGDSTILGNSRMISRWPVRGGAVVKGDVFYFGAGIWPSEGIFIYALDPETGTELWKNDDSGGLEINQPHGGARAKSGISSQGYFTVAGDRLFVPTGRAVPAAFYLKDGAFDYFHLQKYAGGWQKNSYGGSGVIATDSHFFVPSGNSHDRNNIIGERYSLFRCDNGELATGSELDSRTVAVSPDYILFVDSNDSELKALERRNLLIESNPDDTNGTKSSHVYLNTDRDLIESSGKNKNDRRVKEMILNTPAWTIPAGEVDAVSLIIAGNKAVIGTKNNRVIIVDIDSKSIVWSTEVDGIPYGLAAAHECLYVSTDRGSIYCFDSSAVERPEVIRNMPVNFPYGNNTAYASAAVEIIRKTGVTEGFCHDLGCGDGGLSYELAMRTNLHIISVDSDPGMVAEARKRLDEAGIYGKRVTVHCDDGSTVRYPNYFADLIVSGRSVKDGVQIVDLADVNRIQRPFGGIACFGRSGSMELNVRGELENSGLWTHQYSDPANTVTSSDELAKGMLSALWYVDPDFTMPSRHGRSVSPLCSNGRLFVQGLHGIRAYNAYNGRVLWEFYLEGIQNNYDQDSHLGTNLTHANWCVENGRLYVRIEDTESSSYDRCCLVIDTATGNLLKKYSAPAVGGDNTWGYIAVSKGTLFGTVVNDKHDLRFGRDQHLHIDTSKMYEESSALFAMDAETGTVKWLYKANLSIPHNAIAIGNDRVYLIDRPAAALERMSRRPGKKTFSAMSGGTLIALDADTGEEIFRKNDDIYGTLLAYSPENDILVMTYYEAHPLLSFNLPPDTAGRMTAFSDTDGSLLWDVKTGIATSPKNRPILNGEIVFIEPYAWNIRTGKKQSFTFSRSYGCGILAASKCIMVYRSGTLGYFNLNEPEKGTRNYGGIRPGCWINAIPAGGLVLMPDATERCNCSYLIRATMALQPMEK